jgi:hypothetical protein
MPRRCSRQPLKTVRIGSSICCVMKTTGACRIQDGRSTMATIDPLLIAQAAQLDAGQRVPIVLHFETGDGVRAAVRPLRALGFVAYAATPTQVAGEIPASAITRLATVPGLVAVSASSHRRPH